MAQDNSVSLIVCETHEDCIVVFADGSAELVSCKGRSPSKPFTVPALISDGGVRHLFDRWEMTLRSCRCRLMTDGALANGDPKKLRDACHSRDPERIAPWAEKLAAHFDATVETAAEFLAGMTFDLGVRIASVT